VQGSDIGIAAGDAGNLYYHPQFNSFTTMAHVNLYDPKAPIRQ
jgi:hypothetical protein